MNDSAPLVLFDESLIKDLIFEIRGQKVMLDFDLAHIYGYETRYFNRQVKNNIERFDDDFMFQLTVDEVNQLLRCKNFTSWDNGFSGQKGGTRKPPFAFTEHGRAKVSEGRKFKKLSSFLWHICDVHHGKVVAQRRYQP